MTIRTISQLVTCRNSCPYPNHFRTPAVYTPKLLISTVPVCLPQKIRMRQCNKFCSVLFGRKFKNNLHIPSFCLYQQTRYLFCNTMITVEPEGTNGSELLLSLYWTVLHAELHTLRGQYKFYCLKLILRNMFLRTRLNIIGQNFILLLARDE
jgi:hypothetical protein